MSDFAGRHVVVTGGTGALGSAVVERVLLGGGRASIPCIDRAETERCRWAGDPRVLLVEGVDLTDEAAVVPFYRRAWEWGGGGWASVHAAGGFAMGPVDGVTKSEFVALMQMNALTCFLCCREAIRLMKAAGTGGRIVNVAARPALEPRLGANMSVYTASKSAVSALTQAIGEEVATHGILVNAVVPGIMDTPANRAAMPTADHSSWAGVGDVAATICFLVSPLNAVTRSGLVPVYGRA